ncbi:Sorting nexin mvp1 [Coemansia brasiliensis]|uniref:Sorting nexin MVP1 n=1 Tax=Coemansia brasiliensis TaxID=2650707 RepID=A0A9W8M179_9FUNG|nr:Sorting nexin mvp1 [Coemansia brasiliensis]
MSDLYDFLDPWGPSSNSTADNTSAHVGTGGIFGAPTIHESSRRCLDKVVLPPVYAAAFTAAQAAGGGQVTRNALQQTLELSGLPRHIIGQIVLTADTGSGLLTQQDFNLALAMAALAQKNMSPTLESVMFHKDELPVPELAGVESLAKSSTERPHSGMALSGSAPDDPWSSAAANDITSSTAAVGALSLTDNEPDQFASKSDEEAFQKLQTSPAKPRTSNRDDSALQTYVPKINMDEIQWQLDKEEVTIKEAAEKGGIVFKHTNYEVSTRTFSSMVVRRYKDFDWISNYLVTRYPYRMHANLPPKGFPEELHCAQYHLHMSINCGVVDRKFLDNRLKGLTRFANAIMRIPFLKRDALVIQFFTNTDEFAHVLKVGNLDMESEEIDPDEELGDTPWSEVQETYAAFDDFYTQVARDEERYRTQIVVLEKIARYKQAIGDELNAYSDTLHIANAPRESVSGSRKFHVQTASKRALDSDLNELSMSLSDVSLLEKAHGEVLKTISAEYLRRLYDVVVAMKLMMDRMRRTEKRKDIQRVRERNDANRKTLAQLNGESSGSDPADRSSIDRLERLVREDTAEQQKLEHEQRCIEVRFYQELARYKCYESFLQTIYHGYAEEQIKHHSMALSAWKQALSTADDLPTDPQGFIAD